MYVLILLVVWGVTTAEGTTQYVDPKNHSQHSTLTACKKAKAAYQKSNPSFTDDEIFCHKVGIHYGGGR